MKITPLKFRLDSYTGKSVINRCNSGTRSNTSLVFVNRCFVSCLFISLLLKKPVTNELRQSGL